MSESKHCLNCLKDLDGEAKFCAACGQKVQPLKTTLRNMLADFWEAAVSIDGKFIRSFRLLFTRPGQLTSLYFDGKRITYLRPATVFLLAAGIFFICLNWVQTIRSQRVTIAQGENVQKIEIMPGFNVTLTGNDLESVFNATDEEIADHLFQKRKEQSVNGEIAEQSAFEEFIAVKAIRLVRDGGVLALRHQITEISSRSVALLIPIMAVLIKFLHIRRKIFMVDAIVYCLHLHAFLFFVFLVMVLLPNATLRDLSILLLLPITLWYTASSLKRAFGNSIWLAWAKACALLIVHGILVLTLTMCLVLVLLALT